MKTDSATSISLSRRIFLKLAGLAGMSGAAGVLLPGGRRFNLAAGGAVETLPPAPAGACIPPVSDMERTIWMLAETLVPGSPEDPSGSPGANDGCALNVILDPDMPLPMSEASSFVQQVLDQHAAALFGKPFAQLGYDERVAAALEVEQTVPLLNLYYRYIRSAFYAGAYNDIGARWMGYPGENLGYIDHPDFTLGYPVCDGLTDNGNLP